MLLFLLIGMAISTIITLLALCVAKMCKSKKNDVLGAAGDANYINREYMLKELIRDGAMN